MAHALSTQFLRNSFFLCERAEHTHHAILVRKPSGACAVRSWNFSQAEPALALWCTHTRQGPLVLSLRAPWLQRPWQGPQGRDGDTGSGRDSGKVHQPEVSGCRARLRRPAWLRWGARRAARIPGSHSSAPSSTADAWAAVRLPVMRSAERGWGPGKGPGVSGRGRFKRPHARARPPAPPSTATTLARNARKSGVEKGKRRRGPDWSHAGLWTNVPGIKTDSGGNRSRAAPRTPCSCCSRCAGPAADTSRPPCGAPLTRTPPLFAQAVSRAHVCVCDCVCVRRMPQRIIGAGAGVWT